MQEFYSRTQIMLGDTGVEKLKNARVALFGVGGVGSFVFEALLRAGVGYIAVIDGDEVAPSNINRQLVADLTTVGMPKVEAAKRRAALINPDAVVEAYHVFYSAETADSLDFATMHLDYVADAIDSVTSKILLIQRAKEADIPVISCMGAGNKLDPSRFRVTDLYKTSVCPLARVMRRELSKRGIKKLNVVFSDEEPFENLGEAPPPENGRRQTPGSISFVPAAAGLVMASKIIRDLAGV